MNHKNTKIIEYKANTLIVANHEENGKSLFIKVNGPNRNIVLDFSNANDYVALCYNSKGNLISRHYAISGKGSFMIQTPFSTIHLIPFNGINKLKEETMNNQNHPMWDHINASLKEKVDILAENPYRFYIGPNVWVFRNSRQEILEDYLKEAIANEDYELCQKIKEVKTFLSFINNHKISRDYIFILETEETMWDVDVRYYLKKEGNFLKLYTTNDTNEEFQNCNASLEINDYLSKKDIIELLEDYYEKWRTYGGLPRFRKEGLVDEKEFYTIIDSINKKKEHYIKKAKELKTPFIDYLEKVNLNPIPDGKNEYQWLAKCPYSKGKHHIMVSTKNDTYGCGWCKKKGNQRDLENYLKTREL